MCLFALLSSLQIIVVICAKVLIANSTMTFKEYQCMFYLNLCLCYIIYHAKFYSISVYFELAINRAMNYWSYVFCCFKFVYLYIFILWFFMYAELEPSLWLTRGMLGALVTIIYQFVVLFVSVSVLSLAYLVI